MWPGSHGHDIFTSWDLKPRDLLPFILAQDRVCQQLWTSWKYEEISADSSSSSGSPSRLSPRRSSASGAVGVLTVLGSTS